MKQFLDFIPLVIFFAFYKLVDIYAATLALIITTGLQIIISYFIYKKVEKVQLVTFLIVLIFGGMTLFFHNDEFIKWKVTILYIFFSVGLIIADMLGKPVIKGILGKEITLPDPVWKKINWAWVAFFAICAILNVFIAFRLPLDVWVNFKVFGLMIATFAYTVLTGLYIYKHMPKDDEDTPS